MYNLTEEGKKYLKEGLPEINLVQILDKPLSLEEARKRVNNFGIALQWAKKNGWVKIEDGKLVRVKIPKSYKIWDILKAFSEGKGLDEDSLRILLQRKLIRKESVLVKKAEKYVGKEVTNLTPELIKTGLWRKVRFRPYNIDAKGKTIYPGKRHPYNHFLWLVRRKLVELGFKEMTGPLIEMEFWNFDALYQPQNHPSRDWTQTYSLKNPKTGRLPERELVQRVKASHENGWKTGSTGWGYSWDPEKAKKLMPRAHTTACSARRLASGIEIPGKYFSISRCYRPDVIDATHGVEFNQMEGIVIDESLTFKEMLGLLKMFAIEIAGAEKVRFYPDYYPFTEPSVQLSARHPEMGWVEFAGAGIFRPELTEPLGVDQPVIAWGFGIDRLAMYKLGIKDIRYLFSQDIQWLREQKVLRW
ncbi:MAG: phenylalanine--tRNA ligase subunit alpha [Candidatus Aenigmatarchaeota archaeon]|nr:MAG: phenylalanine--tRNA ligase subunit alpha [Candidatus Aenigmarchaeota archaeon]